MLLRLAQGQLTLLTICPRKFQHTVLDQFSTPTPPEQQDHINRGNRFHLLMQQYELGLSRALSTDPEEQKLQQCVADLVQAAPDLFAPAKLRQSEHRRTLDWQGYAIATIYDLLILHDTQAQIIDWKTYPRPQNAARLAKNWQTRLYLFVLAETTDYAPEQLSMTYWFVEPGKPPESLRFQYSATLHQQTQQDLAQILKQLTEWLKSYDAGDALPQVDERQGHCQVCLFAVRCQKNKQTPDLLLPIAEIEEVAIGS
jgi:PD-(D/E)XK nuclease superfamily